MLLGIDIGTQSLKAAVTDLAFNVQGQGRRYYHATFPQAGWAEQAPRLWENAVGPAIADALRQADVAALDDQGVRVVVSVGRDGITERVQETKDDEGGQHRNHRERGACLPAPDIAPQERHPLQHAVRRLSLDGQLRATIQRYRGLIFTLAFVLNIAGLIVQKRLKLPGDSNKHIL